MPEYADHFRRAVRKLDRRLWGLPKKHQRYLAAEWERLDEPDRAQSHRSGRGSSPKELRLSDPQLPSIWQLASAPPALRVPLTVITLSPRQRKINHASQTLQFACTGFPHIPSRPDRSGTFSSVLVAILPLFGRLACRRQQRTPLCIAATGRAGHGPTRTSVSAGGCRRKRQCGGALLPRLS